MYLQVPPGSQVRADGLAGASANKLTIRIQKISTATSKQILVAAGASAGARALASVRVGIAGWLERGVAPTRAAME